MTIYATNEIYETLRHWNLKTIYICTAQKRSVHTLFAAAQQLHSRVIFINQKILPPDKLIRQQESLLLYKVINMAHTCWTTFSIVEMLGIKSKLRNSGDWRIPLHIQQRNLNSLYAIEPSIRGMAYQVTCAAHHRSVLSRINYDRCICL